MLFMKWDLVENVVHSDEVIAQDTNNCSDISSQEIFILVVLIIIFLNKSHELKKKTINI